MPSPSPLHPLATPISVRRARRKEARPGELLDAALALPHPPVAIMMTAYGSVDTAVEAMRRGGASAGALTESCRLLYGPY